MLAASSFWTDIQGAWPLAAVLAAAIVIYATKGIPKARIEGLEGSVQTLETNNSALHDQLIIQQQTHEENRQQDKADCDKRIDELQSQIAHALSEASAARSDVMLAVADTAAAAVRAANQEAMTKASTALAAGQKQIIDKLDVIHTAVGGNQ